jgi:GNAT superfamily N-acetyltransferase
MTIRQMQFSDLDFAAECIVLEGWKSEGPEEFEGFLAYNPNGCFIVEENSKRIGLGVAINYGELGFLGEIVVIKEKRGRGHGSRLVKHAIQYLHSRGVKCILLDSLPFAVSLYERFGFRKICRSLRFSGNVQSSPNSHVRNMESGDLKTVIKIDRDAFGGDREFFLKRRFYMYPRLCKILGFGKEMIGFIMGRPGRGIYWIGPWVISKEIDHPEDLLRALAMGTNNLKLLLGVLEMNKRAVKKIHSLGFVEHSDPPWRMMHGISRDSMETGWSSKIYTIGSPAKG